MQILGNKLSLTMHAKPGTAMYSHVQPGIATALYSHCGTDIRRATCISDAVFYYDVITFITSSIINDHHHYCQYHQHSI